MFPRFYCSPEFYSLTAGETISLSAEASHHAIKVLRLRCGASLVLFDGTGGEYPAQIIATRPTVQVCLASHVDLDCESPLPVTLVQALPGGDKMDWIIQKAVEMGITAIQPVHSRRSIVRLADDRAEKRRLHWQQVVISACEQSGRNRLPEIGVIRDLPHYLSVPHGGCRIVLSPYGDSGLGMLPMPAQGVTLLVGPEGGFDEDEIRLARSAGFQPVRLGPRILRTETAGLAALAAVMTQWGDFL